MGTADAVERAVAPALEDLGFELLDVEAQPGLVRLTIDRSSGLDVDALSEATHAASNALDVADVVPGGRYELEVSSPGVERRLRNLDHYERVLGTRIAVRLKAGVDSERRYEGQLLEVGPKGIAVRVDGESEPRRVTFDDVERCHTVFDWKAAFAADSASRSREEKPTRPTAAERSRAAAAARQGTSNRGEGAGAPSGTLPADDQEVTES